MSRRRTKAEEIRNPEHYFNRYIACERKKEQEEDAEYYDLHESLDSMVERASTGYLPYGYESINRQIQINKEQADVVQKIFSDFLVGRSTEQIAADLRLNNIPCKNGRAQWDSSSVRYILRNEKYTGNSKWQKYYTPSTFPFHCKINAGEVQYYWAEGTHPAIISEQEYQLAQKLLESRSERVAKRHNLSLIHI